ncbi:hypothetical protein CLF_108473 [Clonorchis sinensis]|uniref:Uncharacterized protein n=1 Tax=Clonorchis sinensis TaxID=79923 RepID=G7YI43_CLOSI|nr:hypothetical protein CLF_108473 [Clonorchis sinensis]
MGVSYRLFIVGTNKIRTPLRIRLALTRSELTSDSTEELFNSMDELVQLLDGVSFDSSQHPVKLRVRVMNFDRQPYLKRLHRTRLTESKAYVGCVKGQEAVANIRGTLLLSGSYRVNCAVTSTGSKFLGKCTLATPTVKRLGNDRAGCLPTQLSSYNRFYTLIVIVEPSRTTHEKYRSGQLPSSPAGASSCVVLLPEDLIFRGLLKPRVNKFLNDRHPVERRLTEEELGTCRALFIYGTSSCDIPQLVAGYFGKVLITRYIYNPLRKCRPTVTQAYTFLMTYGMANGCPVVYLFVEKLPVHSYS